MNVFDLTAHQLDVIRTLGSVVGAVGGFLGGIGAVAAFLARYWAKQAAHNTRSETWVNGKLRTQPVAETARHAAMSGEATRQEVSDLAGWVKGGGRRRLPTTDIPRIQETHTYE